MDWLCPTLDGGADVRLVVGLVRRLVDPAPPRSGAPTTMAWQSPVTVNADDSRGVRGKATSRSALQVDAGRPEVGRRLYCQCGERAAGVRGRRAASNRWASARTYTVEPEVCLPG